LATGMGNEMAKKITRNRPWTKAEARMLKSLAREKTKATVIASKLNRSYAATRVKASALGVSLGGGRGR
jgi:hypothetical protein